MGNDKEAMIIQDQLYECREAKFRGVYKVFASTIMASICLVWSYRLINIIPIISSSSSLSSWAWVGMFMSELGFGLYWIITQPVRLSLIRFCPSKEKLVQRYGSNMLPSVDIFICTADPKMEPPNLVINTVLSAMSYNYSPEKLSVYVSDDGCSEFTFYALIEASIFSEHWIPFCKRFNIEPRSPKVYFGLHSCVEQESSSKFGHEWLAIKKLYEDMTNRIDSAVKMGQIPAELRKQHKGFAEWDSSVTMNDHQSIVQIVIDGRDKIAVDRDGFRMPTLVYMSREKRPNYPHNFKAGAMNALIRVSSEISDAPIILNLDCDMYSNNAETIQEILCFFMDEKTGHEFAFVQFPQHYDNVTKNDVYSNVNHAINEIELAGLGGFGTALYCGTGCFHRRESLMGKKYFKDAPTTQWNIEGKRNDARSVSELEESSKPLANCSYENGTQWGKEVGLMYGCPVEDIVTGLAIQCRGWKSVYCNPERRAFLGVAPMSLEVSLVQHKRWCEGMSQIFFSKYCPFTYGYGKIKLIAQMSYSIYLLWAPFSLSTLYYVIVPSLCFLNDVSLFPEVSSPWFIPFAYIFVASNIFSSVESICCGGTLKTWWNCQRMWLFRRTSSYFFAFVDIFKKKLGLRETNFTLTDKVVSEELSRRHEQEIMEFGSSSPMFTALATLALLNLFALVGGTVKLFVGGYGDRSLERFAVQIVLCSVLVLVNFPVYYALFFRGDEGRLPFSVLFKSFVLASVMCLLPMC